MTEKDIPKGGMTLPERVREFAGSVRQSGGRVLVIGGAVRDRLLAQTRRSLGKGGGLPITDYDLEVFGLPSERVEALAREIGEVHDVGKAFGVLEVLDGEITFHISLPRRESKVAPGHRGFAVGTDPTMTPEEAARRRDFTINAIAEDPLTGEVLDPCQGRADLEGRTLRVVDAATFADDPLRVLRGAVFAAQFGLTVDALSAAVIRRTVSALPELPRERVGEEWKKLLLRPERPSLGLKLLMDWGVFAVLHPDFVQLEGTPQNPRWHPEGNVWTHTLMAVDEAGAIMRRSSLRAQRSNLLVRTVGLLRSSAPRNDERVKEEQWWVFLATLCHDLGKATTTKMIRGVWRSIGHDAAGVAPTRRFLRSIAADRRTTEVVVRLVREHLQPLHFFRATEKGSPVRDGAVRKLARRIHPATIFLLTLVADADHRGRGPVGSSSEVGAAADGAAEVGTAEVGTAEVGTARSAAVEAGEQLRRQAEALGILHGPPTHVLRGDDLLALGLAPGPDFGAILRRAEELRDARNLTAADLVEMLRGAPTTAEALRRLG